MAAEAERPPSQVRDELGAARDKDDRTSARTALGGSWQPQRILDSFIWQQGAPYTLFIVQEQRTALICPALELSQHTLVHHYYRHYHHTFIKERYGSSLERRPSSFQSSERT